LRLKYGHWIRAVVSSVTGGLHWKPAIVWRIERIHVLKPIRFASFRRNEVGAKANTVRAERAMNSGSLGGLGLSVEAERQQRATTMLVDVAYVIEAHFDMTVRANGDESTKHISMFNRRAETGQCFHRPCLGAREFPADFALLPEGAALPLSGLPPNGRDRDLGWMLYDIEGPQRISRFFRARLREGVLDVNACLADGSAV
jgi:CRISPR-associated protein Cas5d